MKKVNYHTHHYRCKHASGTISEYVREAEKKGYSELGISCHNPYKDNRIPEDRMSSNELDEYLKEIDVEKTKSSISILKGLECEYFPELHDEYLKLKQVTDYMILGQHYMYKENGEILDSYLLYTREDLNLYKDWLIAGIKSKIFTFLAHPDLFMVGYKNWDENTISISQEILETALEYNMPIEYNVNGLRYNRGYPSNEFWKLVAKDYSELEIFMGSDAHKPEHIEDKYVISARANLEKLGLKIKTSL